MKNENGITMIFLVITVLLLLIIGGIITSVVINQTPIDQAVEAREIIENSQAREELDIILNEYTSDCVINKKEMNIEEFLSQNTGIEKYFKSYEIIDGRIIVDFKDVCFEIEKNGVGYVVKEELSNHIINNEAQNEIIENKIK